MTDLIDSLAFGLLLALATNAVSAQEQTETETIEDFQSTAG